MKKIAISQPRYLPACNYIERMIISDIFVVMDNVQHQKRAFEHRNRILTHNGPLWLSIPIDRKNSQSTIIKDLKILQDTEWQYKHLQSIKHSYKKAPYYNEIMELLEDYYSRNWLFLNDAIKDMFDILIKYLDIDVDLRWASSCTWEQKHDDLLIEMVEYFDGDAYISGPNGRNYIEISKFKEKKISLLFHEYDHPVYDQIGGEFHPYMTIWDLLFYKGKKTTKIIKSGRLETN